MEEKIRQIQAAENPSEVVRDRYLHSPYHIPSLSSIVCGDQKVKQAYCQVCKDCSSEKDICAKCGKKGDV